MSEEKNEEKKVLVLIDERYQKFLSGGYKLLRADRNRSGFYHTHMVSDISDIELMWLTMRLFKGVDKMFEAYNSKAPDFQDVLDRVFSTVIQNRIKSILSASDFDKEKYFKNGFSYEDKHYDIKYL